MQESSRNCETALHVNHIVDSPPSGETFGGLGLGMRFVECCLSLT